MSEIECWELTHWVLIIDQWVKIDLVTRFWYYSTTRSSTILFSNSRTIYSKTRDYITEILLWCWSKDLYLLSDKCCEIVSVIYCIYQYTYIDIYVWLVVECETEVWVKSCSFWLGLWLMYWLISDVIHVIIWVACYGMRLSWCALE